MPERREAVAGSVLCSGGATTGVMRSLFRFGGLDVMPLLVIQGSNVQAVRVLNQEPDSERHESSEQGRISTAVQGAYHQAN